MLNRLLSILSPLLKDYKWYRRKVGGKWYSVRPEDITGWGIPNVWTREPGNDKVVVEEDYSA
jgi:hypothetical protein